ncbi:MAG TPA: hypothetical protein VGA56_11540 [Opitutaceae bacterium]
MTGAIQRQAWSGSLLIVWCSAWLLPGPAMVDGAPLPCAGTLTLDHTDRFFDGARLGIALLRGERLTLATDNLGAWIPLDHPAPGAGITFRHRVLGETSLSICVVSRSEAPGSEAGWKSYVNALRDQSPTPAEIVETRDSTSDISAVSTLGMHTREVLVRRTGVNGDGTIAERQVLAIDDRSALLFALVGPEAAMRHATGDMQFLLARLERL